MIKKKIKIDLDSVKLINNRVCLNENLNLQSLIKS